MKRSIWAIASACWGFWGLTSVAIAAPRPVDRQISCDILVVGGGLAGVATAYEALLAGRQVCITELTDWWGGQISAQGTSALDETVGQRSRLFFPRGYLQLRQRLLKNAKRDHPGDCWVSTVCFLPQTGHTLLLEMLKAAASQGGGQLHLFPNTVVKSLEMDSSGQQIATVRAVQHQPAPGAPPLNTYPLSRTLADSYQEQDSPLFTKTILQFQPPAAGQWYVVEATETGELLPLADLPYRLGIDPRSYLEPSSSSKQADPYCTQATTYTFAMQATATPPSQKQPQFYSEYEPFYSFDKPRYAQTPNLVFTYRRILSVKPGTSDSVVNVGDISMQNWGGGNDYGPGTAQDNLILTRDQLTATGQLQPGQWQGGLRVESLQGGEELAQGYFYWLVAGTTDAKLPGNVKEPWPNLQYLQGLDSPMGTVHGLSKFPYIREGRRLMGRYSYGYRQGFAIAETDVSHQDFHQPYYRDTLSAPDYRNLITRLAGLQTLDVILNRVPLPKVKLRTRARIYADSVGIGHYPIDFHPCMEESPPQKPGNQERQGERQAATQTYPYQIPLRAMIPPRINNLLVTGKNIATSHISAATYRVHSFEWSAGAAAGTTAAFALDQGIYPYQLVENLPRRNPQLEQLQALLNRNQNPTAFPNTSIFNQTWNNW
ncbi:MAG: FAD-dependent oxidoreductase [Acaryochloris sp. RU_4_1]|nr:FAD-dependent oxidoreductase [Acaryochloris sp. RU_4_1]